MNYKYRSLSNQHGFNINLRLWIFSTSFSFSVENLNEIDKPKWLGLLLCKFNKHDYWMNNYDFSHPTYRCEKCDKVSN